jgi:hypothetical protein
MKRSSFLVFGLLTIVLVPQSVYAQNLPALTFTEASGTSGLNQDQAVGWQFDVVENVTVTGLGWFDEGLNGLVTSHEVGIWSPTGTLLASTTVSAGTVNSLVGQFRTAFITPIVLTPGTGYIVGGLNSANNTERLAGNVTPQTTDTRIVYFDATFSDTTTTLVRPTQFSSASTGFYGPSFSIAPAAPEPSTGALFAASGMLGFVALRQRRRRN